MCDKRFPNGFESYLETHFEITSAIALAYNEYSLTSIVRKRHEAQGIGGLYELAQELTDEFEAQHENELWANKDFFETIDEFITKKLYPNGTIN